MVSCATLPIILNSDILNSEYVSKGRLGMDTMKTAIAEIKNRGQLTIPKKIRESSHLEEGQVVSIIPVGDSVIITPKRLELDEARRQIRKIIKASGLSEKELLKGLGEERELLYKEIYGKKKH